MSARPPWPIGVPVTHQRCAALMRWAICDTWDIPDDACCASSRMRRHHATLMRGLTGTGYFLARRNDRSKGLKLTCKRQARLHGLVHDLIEAREGFDGLVVDLLRQRRDSLSLNLIFAGERMEVTGGRAQLGDGV